MINIALKTEYSFRKSFLHMKDIHKYVIDGMVGVADYDNTFAHIPLMLQAQKHHFKPIYGVRLRVSRPENEKRRTGHLYTTFLAKDNDGLKALYKLVTKAWDNFYYFPRLKMIDIINLHPGIVNLGEGTYENYFPEPADREVYELLAGRTRRGDEYFYNFEDKAGPMHIQPTGDPAIGESCNAQIQHAEMVKFTGTENVLGWCLRGADRRSINLDDPVYSDRLMREIDLIKEKDYDDYFLIVADMIDYAKRYMFVGPSRGSSAGSLVCYLMGITEIDPIPFGLIFERFIDVNRFDLPDIDIDFPDNKRELVMKYLVRKYGHDKVQTLANINRLMPKSAIGEFAAGLSIPKWETEAVKGAIIERSSGDARAAMCISDTFDTTDPGKEFIEKYPKMRLVERIEGHAVHTGKHAAGVMVSTEPLANFGAVNNRDGVIMMDKKAAEAIGLLKIDCLGLRTLTILEDAADAIGMPYSDIYDIPLDDEKTFDIFRNMRISGIFQFEGYALQSLTRQMGVHRFDDIVAITALARPGALNSGGASRYVRCRIGDTDPIYINEDHKRITEETYGITVYQEQMMNIAREVGKLSWEDTSTLRKAASKSMGDEFFSKFKDKFVDGAIDGSGLSASEAEDIWNDISHSGSWSFNKSHAVAYGLISYWTAWFKANHPMEFAVANLNHASSDDSAIKFLRDLVENEGIEYTAVDPDLSKIKWSVYQGKLLGGLSNIDGIAEKKAQLIIDMRTGRKAMTPGIMKKLMNPKTPFDIIFPAKHYFGDIYKYPENIGLISQLDYIKDISDEGEYIFLGCLVDRNLRDLNEYTFLKDRDGEIITDKHLYLNLTVEDDTDSIICTINRWKFDNLGGKKIAEEGRIGKDWYLIKGVIKSNWRKIEVSKIVYLNELMGVKI